MDVLWHAERDAGVPARAVQDEDDLLAGAAPDLAGKAASSAAKSGMLTEVARWKTAGRSRLHEPAARSRRGSATRSGAAPGRIGRCPSKHQTLCRIGLRPTRCSSVAQSSTVAAG